MHFMGSRGVMQPTHKLISASSMSLLPLQPQSWVLARYKKLLGVLQLVQLGIKRSFPRGVGYHYQTGIYCIATIKVFTINFLSCPKSRAFSSGKGYQRDIKCATIKWTIKRWFDNITKRPASVTTNTLGKHLDLILLECVLNVEEGGLRR